ncbi:MAG: hypothetical protein WBN83_16650 [Desulfoprunum sp.]|jgi:hypothetical protein|uniref:hypothetical protein n=1 Tax=Desulfoprunum sp. TaxID=2020866 RepID=UPI00052D6BD1|nr:hypothetical protein JT06_02725 [Desulfobulbus sp. Tol-SR]
MKWEYQLFVVLPILCFNIIPESKAFVHNIAREVDREVNHMTEYPLFYQFEVRPTARNSEVEMLAGALATVLVFAETEEVGRARGARFIARQHWEIISVKRVMRMCSRHVSDLQPHFRELYRQAEQYGIAARFDGWARHGFHGRGIS